MFGKLRTKFGIYYGTDNQLSDFVSLFQQFIRSKPIGGIRKEDVNRLSHIKFHKARGRRLYCNTPTTDNAVKFNM